MCKPSAPKMPAAPELPPMPAPPPERQAARMPNRGAVSADIEARVGDRMRSTTATILTSGSGVTEMAQTGGKTLLGQ